MKLIGLTGGIGSGKSVIANLLAFMGAAVYNSDRHAKDLMENNKLLIQQLKSSFGDQVYNSDHSLNRDLLRNLVFNNTDKLNLLNDIVHKAVRSDFKEWSNNQITKLIVFESALILNKYWIDYFDLLIFVHADESIRISRIMDRDQLNEVMIRKIMANQHIDESYLNDKKVFVIDNSGKDLLIPVIWKFYRDNI